MVCRREGVRSGTGFAERVRADRVRSHARQVALPLFFVAPADEGVVDQRVLHIDDDAGGRIDARHFFDRENGLEELRAAAAVLFGDFDSHQSELKEFLDEALVEDALLVHLFDQRAHFLFGEAANVVAKEYLVFGEAGQRSGCGRLKRSMRHRNLQDGIANL